MCRIDGQLIIVRLLVLLNSLDAIHLVVIVIRQCKGLGVTLTSHVFMLVSGLDGDE